MSQASRIGPPADYCRVCGLGCLRSDSRTSLAASSPSVAGAAAAAVSSSTGSASDGSPLRGTRNRAARAACSGSSGSKSTHLHGDTLSQTHPWWPRWWRSTAGQGPALDSVLAVIVLGLEDHLLLLKVQVVVALRNEVVLHKAAEGPWACACSKRCGATCQHYDVARSSPCRCAL